MTAKQMKDLIRNISTETNIPHQVLQRNYVLEKLLERISLSNYKDKFILKGGMLIADIVGITARSTMDLDASIRNTTLSKENIKRIFKSIVSIDIGDKITMIIKNINEIREEFDYSCFRISLEARVDNSIIPMKVDISTGDAITPSEVKYKFNLLLEKRTIEILAYNLETILAEKMETLISRSIFNTRMRDFYDIYILTKVRDQDIDIKILKQALEKTSLERETKIEYKSLESDLSTIFLNNDLKKLWKNYQKKFPYSDKISWIDIEEQVRKLFKELKNVVNQT